MSSVVAPRRLLLDKYFLTSIALTSATIFYFRNPNLLPLIFVPVAVALVRIVLPYLKAKVGTYAIDLNLLYLLLHMHAVSTGRPARARLFQLNNVLGDYGEYDTALRRIATIAVEWGYGFVRAIRFVAREVRNKAFREFLLRLAEVLRIGEDPVRFLEVEYATARRNYQAQYYRALDLMRIILGMHTTIMSSAAFLLTVMAVFMAFMGNNLTIYMLTLIGALCIVILFTIITYIVVPKEWITPRIKPKPKHVYKWYRVSVVIALGTALPTAYVTYAIYGNIELSIMLAGGITLLPGLIATKIENNIRKSESFYPIFVRSFGLTYSVLPNYVRALSSILMSDLGPLTKHVKLVYARLSNGIDPRIAWRYFTQGIWSDLILRSTNILVDSVDVGGNLRSVGANLSDLFIRLNDLRSTRERFARTFEAATYILQMLVAAITISILNILQMFSRFIDVLKVGLEVTEFYGFLPFQVTPETLSFVYVTTMIFLMVLVVVNALTIKLAYGGLPETFWVQISILSIMTASAALSMRLLIEFIFSQLLFPGLIPV